MTAADAAKPLRVLRFCSVFEPVDAATTARPAFDPIGGMQNHTAALTRALDACGVRQFVVTSRLGGARGVTAFGELGEVHRVGLPLPRLRQAWAVPAVRADRTIPDVDLVHAHQGEDLAVLPVALAAARRRDVPLVVTVHCSLRHSVPSMTPRLALLRLLGGPVEAGILARADATIVLTETTARSLAAGLGSRLSVIPSGVELDRFRISQPAGEATGLPGPRIGYVGRFARQKDVPTLVRAFGGMRCDASLLLVGDGPDRHAVDAAIADLTPAKRDRLQRMGFRPHDDVPGLLAALDVLVLPSIYEEMGSILVEAMHAGLPVVATRVGGIPDVVVDGVTGLLIPAQDSAAMAEALDRLVASPQRRREMGGAARSRSAGYGWDGLAARTLAVYERVAKTCSSSRTSASRSAV